MNNEEQILKELKELKERREHRRGRGEGRGHGHHPEGTEGRAAGAKTFRRKRATSFLENLETKRDLLKKQLETPELQSINQVIVGELKATETIISEFVQLFELYEFEEYRKENKDSSEKEK